MIVAGIYIDLTDQRVVVGIATAFLQLISGILLVIPNIPAAGVFTAFYISGTSFVVNPILYGWATNHFATRWRRCRPLGRDVYNERW
jgi:ACS family pantothenate transporter-like MFS transporter